MKLYSLLVVLGVGVHGLIYVRPAQSRIQFVGDGCPSTLPEPCTAFTDQLAGLDEILKNPDHWVAFTDAGRDCTAAVNREKCTVETEIALQVSGVSGCGSHLVFTVPSSYLTNWLLREVRDTGANFPDCAAAGAYFTMDGSKVCITAQGSQELPVRIVDGALYVDGDISPVVVAFPKCAKSDPTIIVELIPHATTTTTTEAEADSQQSEDSSQQSEDSSQQSGDSSEQSEDGPTSEKTDPNQSDTDSGSVTENPISPASATRSAVLSVLPLAIIGTIY